MATTRQISGETWTPQPNCADTRELEGTALYNSDVSRQWQKLLKRMTEIRELRNDWDGEGALAPNQMAVKSVNDLLALLRETAQTPPTRIAPAFDGAIVVEWQLPDGLYRSAEIRSAYVAEVMDEEPGKPPCHRTYRWNSLPRRYGNEFSVT